MASLAFERFFNCASDLCFIADEAGVLMQVNAAFQRRLGWQIASLAEPTFTALIHPDDVERVRLAIDRIAAEADPVEFVCRCRCADGSFRTLQWTTTRDAELFYAIGRDLLDAQSLDAAITAAWERERQATEALQRSESRLAEAQRLACLGSWELDLITNHLWWSAEVYRVFEIDPAHFGASYEAFLQIVHPDDRTAVDRAYWDSVATRTEYEIVHRLLMADGRIKYVHERAQTHYADDGTPIRSFGTMQEITERKLAENDLLRKDAAIAASLNGVAIADLEANLAYVNQAFLNLWGYTDASQVLGRSATSFWNSPVAAQAVVDALRQHGTWSGELIAVRTDGKAITMQVSASLFSSSAGAPMGLLATFLDITERKQAEDALRLKDQAIDSALNAVVITDAIGNLIYVNPAFLRLWGYASEEEVRGRPPTDFADPDVARQIIAQLQLHGSWQGELVARRQDATTFDVLLSASVVHDGAGAATHIVASLLDISEIKLLQARFLQAQKMEAIGRLAGGVAHDFNNLLTVMKGYLDLVRSGLSPDDPLSADLGQIDKAIDSAASLTQQLLAFSRQQIIAPRLINANEVILRMRGMLRRLIGEDIELSIFPTAGGATVMFDPSQFEQIILNLAINARDAMPHGGKLTIETARVRIDEEYLRRHPGVLPGDYIMLAVSDTGSGISPAARAHLFEPFFTTKEPGKGTGLGLAMVYGAVSQNGGRIEVYSEPEQGSTFKIYLPEAAGAVAQDAADPAAALPTGNQTILLIEDDDEVRLLATRMLEHQGYRVYAFESGPAALSAIATIDEPIHLLITDVIMPKMNGRDLAERVRALRPAIRVLFTSGYTVNVIVHHGVLKEGVEFLPKPYSIASLTQRVNEVLSRPPDG